MEETVTFRMWFVTLSGWHPVRLVGFSLGLTAEWAQPGFLPYTKLEPFRRPDLRRVRRMGEFASLGSAPLVGLLRTVVTTAAFPLGNAV